MNCSGSFAGMLEVRITSAEPEKILDAAAAAHIPISKISHCSDLIYQLQIRQRDYHRLETILHHRGDHIQIIKKSGLYWKLKAFARRPVLAAGLLVLLISSFFIPTRIYFFQVEGNTQIPTKQILEAAEACGIHFAASRKTVRSEKVKNALLSAIPQLQWAGVNTSGCTAVISVREKEENNLEQEEKIVSNLIADRDGYILSGTTVRGTALFQPGQTVAKGQVLISGYTDCGIFIQAGRAEGEVFAQTSRSVRVVTPKKIRSREKIVKTKRRYSLQIRKKRINLWKGSRISDTDCGRMYEEYFVSLPGGFPLPIALCVDQYIFYDTQDSAVMETETILQLQSFSDGYLFRQMVAGQILEKQRASHLSEGLYVLESNYICTEMIGKEQREQIGDINGKRN